MDDSQLAILGYEHYYQMLSDDVRMAAFRSAIFKTVKPGDVVLDLGAGTGILSFWALQAGASKVYAIEKTNAIDLAREVARFNGMEDRIEFLQKNSVDVELSEKVDVIVSETLGSFGVDENILEFILDARKRFLVEGGRMVPETLELFVAPVDDRRLYAKLDIWKRIDGLDFTPAFDLFSSKIMIEDVAEDRLLSKAIPIGAVDFRTFEIAEYRERQYIAIERMGAIHGVAGWFRCRLCEGVEISTAPGEAVTHWKQAFFPFKEPVEVISGDLLDLSVAVMPAREHGDDTRISYDYRCTQRKNELREKYRNLGVGRNEVCPCGSGKKFKKCCGG